MALMPRMRSGEVARRLSVLGMVKDPKALIQFLTYDAQLGNRTPAPEHEQYKFCMLCIKEAETVRLNEPHLLFACNPLREVREEWRLVEYAEEVGGTIEDVYGCFWRTDGEVRELDHKVEAACAVRKEYWKQMKINRREDY